MNKRKLGIAAALALGFALVGLADASWRSAGPGLASSPARALPSPGTIGSHLPSFALKDLQGEELSSEALRGKVALIDFWATWCEPCKTEMAGYQKLLDRYRSRGFAVVGFKLSTMPDTEDPLALARSLGVRYPLAPAANSVLAKFGGIEGIPTTLIYDRQGVLRKKVVGFEYTSVIEAEVKQLL